MKTKQLLGLIGTLVLILGVFIPVLKVPFAGEINLFKNGEGDGSIILFFAFISLILVLVKKYKGLLVTGVLSLLIIVYDFVEISSVISEAKADLESDLAGNPFRGLADMAMESMQMQWGWAVLFIGVGLVIASAVMKDEEAIEPVPVEESDVATAE